MRSNYVQFNTPQFRILSDRQIEELQLASLQIMERTGVCFESEEALELLGNAGADVTDPNRVKIPSYLVEQAVRTAPKTITIYTRDGEPAMVLNGLTTHFGGHNALAEYLDPYTRQKRPCYVEDIAEMARVIDALPNIEWSYIISSYPTLPGSIADKVAILHSILNTSKPVAYCLVDVDSLREVLEVCAMVAGGEKELQAKPFLIGSAEPVTPLMQGKEIIEKSLLCAEKGIPNFVYSAPLAGTNAPATFAGALALGVAEFLSQLVAIQLKKPGAPVVFGCIPTIMDMKTLLCSYGNPETALLAGAIAEIGHHFGMPVFGRAGAVDADIVDAQASAEATYQIMISALVGADLNHGLGEMDAGRMASPEFAVFGSEVVDMMKVSMGGIEINDETLPLDLIDRIGPRGSYISEKHTLQHFRNFWVPTIFDRSMVKDEKTKRCGDLLNEKTIEIIETHQPKPLPEDMVKELKKVEEGWLKRVGLTEYPKRPQRR
jgi:trimethylamine--corrinoid protein Co-methyltransferase